MMSIFDKLKAFFGGADSNGTAANGASDGSTPEGGVAGGTSPDPIDMISCEDALRLVHEFLDGELESASEGQVRSHFDMCQKCYPHLHLETVYRDALRRAAAGESAPAELKARVSALLADAEAGS
jgi:anti-sigma factor (TIGR02949 family)